MYFANNNLLDGIYLILNTTFFFGAIILLCHRMITNKFGILLVLVSSFVVMLEVVLKNLGISIFPILLLGDILWIITSVYSLNKLHKL